MIYFLSDLHCGMHTAGLNEYLQLSTENDLLIILGDVCLNFESTKSNREFTEYFLSLDRNIAFLDGNHENYAFLADFPEVQWCGSTVHRLTDRIVHLQRGSLYTIQGDTFFVMGGCKSSPRWQEAGLWDPRELPTARELEQAYETLRRCDHKVSYILTHKYAREDPAEYPPLQELIDYLDDHVTFRHWYSGHWHRAFCPDEMHTVVYDKLIKLQTNI